MKKYVFLIWINSTMYVVNIPNLLKSEEDTFACFLARNDCGYHSKMSLKMYDANSARNLYRMSQIIKMAEQ